MNGQTRQYGMAALESNDLVVNYSDKRYVDALGKKIESKCSHSLLYIIKHHKTASIDTMIKKCTLGVQVIKQTLTLTKVALLKSGKWRLIEMRSSRIPISWELRSHWHSLVEMLATICDELLEQRKLDNLIIDEVCSLRTLPSKSVIDHFLNLSV
ncbi:unnamed protein product [Rhizopus stolonifer]